MGGEKSWWGDEVTPKQGSPPRGRGKEVADEGIGGIIRITPAWTGKRRERSSSRTNRRDHPRVGGEKFSRYRARESNQGSPPHGRGKARSRCFVVEVMRITPAWAGKSQGHRADRGAEQDHPRVGGEKRLISIRSVYQSGSPPHGRGKVSLFTHINVHERITPAWAGKRCQGRFLLKYPWDYPRVGGENPARPRGTMAM